MAFTELLTLKTERQTSLNVAKVQNYCSQPNHQYDYQDTKRFMYRLKVKLRHYKCSMIEKKKHIRKELEAIDNFLI